MKHNEAGKKRSGSIRQLISEGGMRGLQNATENRILIERENRADSPPMSVALADRTHALNCDGGDDDDYCNNICIPHHRRTNIYSFFSIEVSAFSEQ